jgi:two-component system, NarL family, nitrate/nitrite response regulator NarL
VTTLVVVSDIRLYRDGLAEVLGRRTGLDVVGVAASLPAAIGETRQRKPDIVLVDMAAKPRPAAVRDFVLAVPDAKVVALALANAEEDVLDYAEAGIVGYVTRESSLDELVSAIESVARDEMVCSPRMTATLLRRVAELAASRGLEPARAARLTGRELQIVRLIDDGLSNKEIARRLYIEVATVKNHVHNILEKLQVRRRAEAATKLRAATREGALSGPLGRN